VTSLLQRDLYAVLDFVQLMPKISVSSCEQSLMCKRGVATGGISVFIPPPPKKKKISPSKFLWGKNDVRAAIQQFYTPKTFIPPKQISGYALDVYQRAVVLDYFVKCFTLPGFAVILANTLLLDSTLQTVACSGCRQ